MRHAATLACACLLVAACGKKKPNETAAAPAIDSAAAALTGDTVRDTTRAVGDTTRVDSALIQDATGKQLGSVMLKDTTGGIKVDGEITGLAQGNHGFHIHMVGRCDPPGFESSGEHWNPTHKQHGFQNPSGPHEGDLANLGVGTDGVAQVHEVTHGGSLKDLMDADGAAFVVHANPDDNKTDPSGNSGPRIACGVIRAKP